MTMILFEWFMGHSQETALKPEEFVTDMNNVIRGWVPIWRNTEIGLILQRNSEIPGLIDIFKHIFWGLHSGGRLYSGGAYIQGGLIFGGHFVLVSEYQDLKIHCNISLL